MKRFHLIIVIAALAAFVQAALESVPFQICAESNTWTRPAAELQANKIWKDARYKDVAREPYAWTHNFLVTDEDMSISGVLAVTNLSGLWTVKTQWLHKCYLDRPGSSGSWIQVVSLLHRVKEVQYDGNTYTVIVEPSDKGFQWLFIRRFRGWAVLRFVTPEGKQVDLWDNGAAPARLTRPAAATRK